MKNIVAGLLFCLILSACQPQPLPERMMRPDPVVYSQIQKEGFFLQNKVSVGEFESDLKGRNDSVLFSSMRDAVQVALETSKLLGDKTKDTEYILSGRIKDVSYPKCFFGTCEGGATVEYMLEDAKTKKVVYHDLIVVAYNCEYSIFSPDYGKMFVESRAEAVGENIAHLIHVLTTKKKADLEGGKQ